MAKLIAFALSGLIRIIRLIHRALPYAIAGAPLGRYLKIPIAL